MAENSKIEWTDHTFNPWRGCVHVKGSRACAFCYAEKQAKRNPAVLGKWGSEEGGGTRVIGAEDYWRKPLRWNLAAGVNGDRMRVFCASMADVFEDWRGPMLDTKGVMTADTLSDVRGRLWLLIEATPNLDWLLLTKRPENVLRMVPASWLDGFPANVWVGVTVEDQRWADERIPHLLTIPARVRFLSCEPLVGPVDLTHLGGDRFGWGRVDALSGIRYVRANATDDGSEWQTEPTPRVHWVIPGGESGPQAQPSHPDWFRSLRDQCVAAGVSFLFKQWGEFSPYQTAVQRQANPNATSITYFGGQAMYRVGKKAAGRLLDGRTWDELPEAARV